VTDATSSFWGRHEFLIRRLHSLTGLIPVGAYMVVHLVTNASVLDGPGKFQAAVYQIHTLGAVLPLVEWVFIFLPIIFHGVIGLFITAEMLPNNASYGYTSNFRYTMQRVTGLIAFAFIAYHVFHMHGWFHAEWWHENVSGRLGGANFRPYNAASSAALALQSPIALLIYVVGVLACVYHLANGLWSMGVTWGLWTTPNAMRRALTGCAAFGILLAVVSMGSLYGMYTVKIDEARETEARMMEARLRDGLITQEEANIKSAPADNHTNAAADDAAESTKF
jgi:succinate dehydrogenase / fumarate reductase cytochrome b subunit